MSDSTKRYPTYPQMIQALINATPEPDFAKQTERTSTWVVESGKPCDLSSQYAGPTCKS